MAIDADGLGAVVEAIGALPDGADAAAIVRLTVA